MKLDVKDERVQELLQAWGVPYSYGAGKPSDGGREDWYTGARGIRGGVGYDCSGFVQVAQVRLGLLSPAAADAATGGLWEKSDLVKDQPRVGDMAFYGKERPTHVMLCLGGGVVMGATGGYPTTNADMPTAYVSLQRLTYWTQLLCVRRLR